MNKPKIIIPGGAGLVGQNLIPRLEARGASRIVVIDKHSANLKILSELHPGVTCEVADLAQPGEWSRHFVGAGAVIMLQAQIGGLKEEAFAKNNQLATQNILDEFRKHNVDRLIHISSSAVNSVGEDMYTRSKKSQEDIVIKSGIQCPILRPTLMFGWFDRKHLGWLSRFMQHVPVFPIPGSGKYARQPLYVGDFSNIIISCLENSDINGTFDISGLESIDYIDLITTVKEIVGAKTWIVKIPYGVFRWLLWTWCIFDRNPPFTTEQLAALTAGDKFDVIDWPGIFHVKPTALKEALEETFNHPQYSDIALEF